MNATEWLVAFVRDVMSKDFQATHLAKILQRVNPQVPSGVDALKWIERVYMAALPHQQAELVCELTHCDHRRLSNEAIKQKCKGYLLTVNDLQIDALAQFLEKVLDDMAGVGKERTHYHLAFKGPKGVGKSTSTIMLLQDILNGKFHAGLNETLQRDMSKLELETEQSYCNYIYIPLDDLTEAGLRNSFKEQIQHVDTGTIVTIIHLEECDKLSAKKPSTNQQDRKFMASLQSLVENNYNDNKWFPSGTTTRRIPQVTIFVWTGNIFWNGALDLTQARDLQSARASVHRQLKGYLTEKFADGGCRMPQQENFILLR